ncbi:MAG: hypothetical protein U1F35_17720 [Steroidobacteraceae bacterium]
MRSPEVPPNHQSSLPATHTEAVAPASAPCASMPSARSSTSPETPGATSHISKPCALVRPAQRGSSRRVSVVVS